MSDNICDKVLGLWKQLKEIQPNLEERFSEECYLNPNHPFYKNFPEIKKEVGAWYGSDSKPLSEDEKFLAVLHWVGGQECIMWNETRKKLEGKPLHELNPENIKRKPEGQFKFRYDWQFKFLGNLVNHLRKENKNMDILVKELKHLQPEEIVKTLKGILKTDSTKIITCYMRDYLLVDAFPIDTRVRKVLDRYDIPPNTKTTMSILQCCKKLKIPVRPFARAVYKLEPCLLNE